MLLTLSAPIYCTPNEVAARTRPVMFSFRRGNHVTVGLVGDHIFEVARIYAVKKLSFPGS